ncbi:MAG: hypothetical protein V4608_06245 [Bacteroidota bacterium]
MKNHILILFFFSLMAVQVSAQDANNEQKGTIKVQKRGHLSKIQFDNVNYRLVGIDQYGNVLDSAVIEFEMSVTIRGIFYSEKTAGQYLSGNMQKLLARCDQTSKIIFDKIKAKDKNGTILDMPKFQYAFGYSEENNE